MKFINRKIVVLIFAVTLLIYQGITYAAPPTFDEGSTTTRSVDKGTYPLQDLGDPVSATDDDGDILTYTVSGTDAALFEIDSTNGQLSNKDFLDYEDKTSYSVTITVSDNKGGTDTITVTITDDKSPVAVIRTFIRQNENWVLELDSVTGVVSAIIPADDRPINSDSNVASFTRPPGVEFDNSFIVAIDFDEEVSGLAETDLTLIENTAGANVTSSEIIMGWRGNNTVTQYRAKVEVTQSGSVTFNVAAGVASDDAGNSNAAAESKTVTVTITLTDYPPWDVNEDGSVDATDTALVTTAIGQSGEDIVNKRTDVNWDDTVDADDVTLVTYHTDSVDDPTPNNPPTFDDGDEKTVSVSENTAINTEIVRLPVTDPDNDIVGALMFGNPWARPGDFTIDSIRTETNQYVVVLKNTVTLDYETQTSYHYTVSVSDENGESDSISVTINITNDPSDDTPNNPPVFTDGASTTRSIAENMSGGSNVGSAIAATDSDNDTLTYRIDIDSTDLNSFSINSTTGQLQSSTRFDYETKNSYEVTVIVSDGRGSTDSITVTISITNDTSDDPTPNNPPSFTDGPSTTRSIQENTTLGTNISSPVSATDDDSGDTLTYSLGGTDAGSFSIVRTTGQLQTSAALDYETQQSYELTITVSDGNGGSDSITLTINVTDVDENPPVQQQVTSVPPTDPVLDQQVSETVQQDDVQQPKSEADSDPVQPQSGETPTVGSKISTTGLISFSELMVASESGDDSLAQWIELYNNSDTEAINLKDWQLEIEARDDNGAHRHAIIPLEDLHILPNQTRLIVTGAGRNSEDLSDNRVYNFFDHHSDVFEQNEHQNMVLGSSGLYLKLSDPDGIVSDVVGNLDGGSATEDEPAWELPSGTTEDDVRTSLLRRYEKDTDMPLDGTELNNWRRASELELSVIRYWGKTTDIGNPGYRGAGALPVTLSHFHVERAEPGVVLKWTTESELNNAGFYILRSEKRDGTFKQVNSRMIQGAGTTGERNTYTWTDTTTKPDIVYYYRIEDVSFAGSRNQLATVRTRGQISASEKHITQWGNLKKRN